MLGYKYIYLSSLDILISTFIFYQVGATAYIPNEFSWRNSGKKLKTVSQWWCPCKNDLLFE